jgi:hypothetical protein
MREDQIKRDSSILINVSNGRNQHIMALLTTTVMPGQFPVGNR